jgi:hypothetical protein
MGKDYNNFLAGRHETLTKFNVLLGKSSLECYKMLKEGLWSHAASYETVRKWVNAMKSGWEETGAPFTVEPQHR